VGVYEEGGIRFLETTKRHDGKGTSTKENVEGDIPGTGFTVVSCGDGVVVNMGQILRGGAYRGVKGLQSGSVRPGYRVYKEQCGPQNERQLYSGGFEYRMTMA